MGQRGNRSRYASVCSAVDSDMVEACDFSDEAFKDLSILPGFRESRTQHDGKGDFRLAAIFKHLGDKCGGDSDDGKIDVLSYRAHARIAGYS